MAYEYDTKSVLLDLMKEGENRCCMDCETPMPQWCSLTYAVYLCLQCSGVHRSLGTHLSFVRSLTMDKWTPVQIKKMQLGGNSKAREFFEAGEGYGGKAMPIADKYSAHFASQYKEKLAADVEGLPWTPSAAPAPASALRKPRLGTAQPGLQRALSSSSAGGGSDAGFDTRDSQKQRNEDYFARQGAANANRRDDLPPSQGGKYGGFGSGGASGGGGGSSGGGGLGSRNAPRLDEFASDPVGALGKGWGLFSSALGGAARQLGETVADPNLQSSLGSYAQRAAALAAAGARAGSTVLATGLDAGSELIRKETGYNVGDLGASALGRATGTGRAGGSGGGYAAVGSLAPEAGGEDDFFGQHLQRSGKYEGFGSGGPASSGGSSGLPSREATPQLGVAPREAFGASGRVSPAARVASPGTQQQARTPVPVQPKVVQPKKDDDWDEW